MKEKDRTKPQIVVIAGATATGKTKTAVELCKRINGEVISADSMQVYKYMDIGTAKPTKEEMGGVPHYLIDEKFPHEEYNVAVFTKMAAGYGEDIIGRGKIPVLCGGTGFYINALLYGGDFSLGNADLAFREEMLGLAREKGNLYLHGLLAEADPQAAAAIHPNNLKRVVRALEYNKQTGAKISCHNEFEKKKDKIYQFKIFILDIDRDLLYHKINERVDSMIAGGLVEEVDRLLKMGYSRELVSMQGLGYKETAGYLQGDYGLEEAVERIKRNTRHFAKRQVTWFKHQTRGNSMKISLEAFPAGAAAAGLIVQELSREAYE